MFFSLFQLCVYTASSYYDPRPIIPIVLPDYGQPKRAKSKFAPTHVPPPPAPTCAPRNPTTTSAPLKINDPRKESLQIFINV